MTLDDLIDQFLDTCHRAAKARGERAQAIGRLAVRLAAQLRERRQTLLDRLYGGWTFLVDGWSFSRENGFTSKHSTRQDYAALEDRWIRWLNQYEKIEDALASGLSVWLVDEVRG
ncbi:MAG: hypothetical protein WBA46_01245 [Thermomicrobiales bacterium]